jgi:thiosulfate dehydrogenase [quinone] large subunit
LAVGGDRFTRGAFRSRLDLLGGSRRFIYAPSKLDPSSPESMANKFQSAMPGALLGMDRIVDYLLHDFYLLYASVVGFSAAELVFGLFLIIGLMTRLSALVTIGLSVILMLLFGWQGATCLDEWTMAACNFAMGVTLFIAGSAAYSLDHWMMRRRPSLGDKPWFRWCGSGLWTAKDVKRFGILGAIVTVSFVVLTYNHYRGAVVTAFHEAPVSPSEHHISLSDGTMHSVGGQRRDKPLAAARFEVPKSRAIDTPLVAGAAIFGVGWGIAGYCPGPAVAGLGVGSAEAFLFVIAMLAGSAIHGWVFSRK